jgi:tetratricopeptide (TPR) repeat protein
MSKKSKKKGSPAHQKPLPKKTTKAIWKSFWSNWDNILALALVLAISFIVYIPSLQHGFVNWDDDRNIYENPYILNITNWETFFSNLKNIFTTHVIGNYNPLSILSFAFEKVFYGFDHLGYWHLDNILLHLVCVMLVFRIALALKLKLIPAVFLALLFGVHPMRVESVAWLTERKDVLFGSFYLLALYYYIKSVRLQFKKRYLFIILFSFILALFSKIQAVSLPLSMLAIDYYLGRKLSFKLITEKWLYFTLSLAIGILGVYFLRIQGSLESNTTFPFIDRVFIGSYSYILYIIKSIVPYKMVPMYPYPASIGWPFYVSMIPALAVLTLIYYAYKKQFKALTFGLVFFTFNIMFLLQILSAGQGFIADRFTYVAYFGLFFVYAIGFQYLLENRTKYKTALTSVAGMLIITLGSINFQQNKIWENGDTLWSHVLKYYQNATLPWGNRANYYRDQGKLRAALHDYNKTISLNPNKPEPFNSRGKLYFNSNSVDTIRLALQDYSRAIELAPDNSEYRVNRGSTHARLNMLDKALQDLNEAQKLDPNNKQVYYNRSIMYHNTGQFGKEEADVVKYLQFNPYHSDMWSNLGVARRINKKYDLAIQAFNRAIQLNPGKLPYYYERCITYHEMGDFQKAKNDLNFLKSNGFQNINPSLENSILSRN